MEENMNAKIINIVLKLLLMLIILIILIKPNISYAFSLTDILHSGENFIDDGKSQNSVINFPQLQQSTNAMYNILFGIGVILSVLVGAMLGVKIMWGSIEQQTKAKEALMPYVIGCVVIFGAFAIWKIAVTIFAQI